MPERVEIYILYKWRYINTLPFSFLRLRSPQRGRQIPWGRKNLRLAANNSLYLGNGTREQHIYYSTALGMYLHTIGNRSRSVISTVVSMLKDFSILQYITLHYKIYLVYTLVTKNCLLAYYRVQYIA